MVAAVSLACALAATAHVPALADPKTPRTLTEVRGEIQRLYRDAEVATEKYNDTEEKLTRQRKRVTSLNAEADRAEAKVARLTTQVGAAARAQYRGGGGELPPELQFLFAADPERALDAAALARQAQQATADLLATLTTTRQKARDRRDDASAELIRIRTSHRTLGTQRKKIEQRIAAAKKSESRLEAQQRSQLAALEKKEAVEAQAKWKRSGNAQRVGTTAGPAGRKAIAFATRQIGKPYVWGAEGPDSFDCSGLTSQAWLHAGVAIPRTSQEQWRQLKHVPVAGMRPGDLIIYFADATHVGIYIGGGQIIQAPRPGRSVYVSPVASMPILGVVRPDA
ncbi:NlpC/P60 family protein [Streptomyces sp. P5-A9]|uniref:C40 family peptidase n=1 Tax=Streptomyces sp. P5-A9 TaxID=3071730 RepID=UPI002FCC84C2